MMAGPDIKNQEYFLDGILRGDAEVLDVIYQKYFPGILTHIRKNNGNRVDAEDVFQDAIIVLFKKQQEGPLELKASFHTYLFAICKNLWLKQLRKRKKIAVSFRTEMELTDKEDWAATIDQRERDKLYREKFRQLGEDCQKLLKLFFTKTPMIEIARIMGYASEGYAKKRKYVCKQKLNALIIADPAFAELKYQ